MNIDTVRSLRREGKHEEACNLALRLLATDPGNAELQLEAASIHDFLGQEAAAVPFYLNAMAGELGDSQRLGAYVGLGSTYRTLGRYKDAEKVLLEGRARFPMAKEIWVFLAMTQHNLGKTKEAFELLLGLLAETSNDDGIREYRRAIALYAQDIAKTYR